MAERIGITAMMPVEIIFEAGAVPLDLRNFFLTHPDRSNFVQRAEMDGYPHDAGIIDKGIYGAVMESKIDKVVVVFQQDSLNHYTLVELLRHQGVEVYTFVFPNDRDRSLLDIQMRKLAMALGVAKLDNLDYWKFRLGEVRQLAHKIDQLTWSTNLVSGYENHKYLLSTADFEGDVDIYMNKLYNFIDELRRAKELPQKIRLGLVGDIPICTEIYKVVERCGARIVFNEVQRQYTMPFSSDDVVDQYIKFTIPYSIDRRVEDIKQSIQERKLHGLIHCINTPRSGFVRDIIFRSKLDIPIFSYEENDNFALGVRTVMGIADFVKNLAGKIA